LNSLPEITVLLLVVTIISYLLFGLVVIINNKNALTNRLMLVLAINTCVWAFSVLMVTVLNQQDAVLFWIRASYATGIFIPWHVYALGNTFHRGNISLNKTTILLLIGSMVFAVISFSPFMVAGVKDSTYLKEPLYGSFYIPFFTFYAFAILLSIQQLYKILSISSGLQRMQIKYLFIGTILSIFLSTMTNVLLPLMGIVYLGTLDVRSLGPVFALILVGMVTYAIVRYRFMDIRFAFRRYFSVIIMALILAGVAILLVRILFYWNIVSDQATAERIVAFIVFIFVITLPFLKELLQVLLEKVLFRSLIDYHKNLPKKVRSLENILELELLLNALLSEIVENMDLDYGFYCKNNNGEHYTPSGLIQKTANVSYNTKFKGSIDPLFEHVAQNREILMRSDLRRSKKNKGYIWLAQIMEEAGIEVIVPLVVESEVEGLLALGAKHSGEPFYHEDIDLLSSLASQVSATLINARLYEEILAIKQYQENILLNMGNGLVAVDENEIITVFNSEAEFIFGLSAEMAIGKMIFPALGEDLCEVFRQTLEKGSGINQAEIILRAGNKTRYLTCNTSVVESPESHRREVILVLSNVTRIKELENERSKSQRLVSLGEVAAGIAHEIKNPLVSIKTFADLLPEKYNDYDFRNMFSNVVSQEISRINNLVGELLNFVKEPVLLLEHVNIQILIGEVIALLSPQFDNQGININLEYPDEQIEVKVDRTLIKQALLNIFVNAVQAMTDGGKLIAGMAVSDQSLVVFIEDTGVGIPEAIRDKIFDPFVTNKADGVGIGLSICHKIIKAHGGRIVLHSREGIGSRFEIILPLS
jgi:PAS domain S-box-containing protein